MENGSTQSRLIQWGGALLKHEAFLFRSKRLLILVVQGVLSWTHLEAQKKIRAAAPSASVARG